MRKRITDSRALRLAGGAAAVAIAAGLGSTQMGLVDLDSLLRLTDIYDLNPLW